MIHLVSVIHGARRVGDSRSYRPRWPILLGEHLVDHGFTMLPPFYWDGDVRTGLSKSLAHRYVEEFNSALAALSPTGPISLSVLGKSLGATIFEHALARFRREFIIDIHQQRGVFLRVATPDARRRCCIPSGFQTVNLRSNADGLYRSFVVPLTLWSSLRLRCVEPQSLARPVILDGLTHRDFNHNHTVRPLGREPIQLFDLYSNLLTPSGMS
ncbi:MAG: hypothetical protein H6926_05240 [Chromatiales bacterium]|nr:hypothetical protein [Chromatiales bacterium]